MKELNIALIGNPNTGKSTIFNLLTGLRQKTSNFPGVTVEKKIGNFEIEGSKIIITDLPGIYSLFPNSKDEKLVCNILFNEKNEAYPDLIVYIVDINQLERHLLLATQIIDLKIPCIIVLNMSDVFYENGNEIDTELLQNQLGVPIIITDARKGLGIEQLKKTILSFLQNERNSFIAGEFFYNLKDEEQKVAGLINDHFYHATDYQSKLVAHHHHWLDFLKVADVIRIKSFIGETAFEDIKYQIHETMTRYAKIQHIMQKVVKTAFAKEQLFTLKLDAIFTHRVIGPIIFFSLMFLIFQSIFSWAEYPMTWIEDFFSFAGRFTKEQMPASWFTNLFVDGLLAGLSGVLVFVPQIALLFFFLSLLEESGYMSRVVFMFDNIMQKVGLNGRSMVALISSGACAIPAIMSTRTIGNWKERLITIMVAPLIPCSARIPVYTVLIALVFPISQKIGVFNIQGIAFMALYLLGIVTSLLVALLLNMLINTDERSYLMIELPQYKKPIWKNVLLEVKDKLWSFITSAGKIIIVISIILWGLASFGPGADIENASEGANKEAIIMNLDEDRTIAYVQSKKLEASYAGLLGKFIEPVISPLGFDWKIGIALLTSFAAREVFVGTMATIYSIGSDAEESSVRSRMAAELRSGTDQPMYNLPTALSLMIFYAFAMQCMSTLAVTKKETNSWKWPIIQFLFMTALAYLGSLLVYQILT